MRGTGFESRWVTVGAVLLLFENGGVRLTFIVHGMAQGGLVVRETVPGAEAG